MTATPSARPIALRGRGLLALLAFLYLFPFPYFPILRSPNEGSRLYQVRAIVDDGTLSVNGPLARFGPMGDLAEADGRYYPNKAPGISFLGAAVYAAAKALVLWRADRVSNEVLLWLLRATCCALPTLLLLAALRAKILAWTDSEEAADVTILAYGLGSLAYTYGLLFFSHQLCAALLAGAFLALETAREEDRLAPAAWAGAMAGGAVLVEYTAALAALPLGLYALFAMRRKLASALSFGLASLPPQIALLFYHRIAYGGFFDLGYRHNVNRQFQAWHDQGFMGVTTPTLRGLAGSFFSPARGLFVFSPFLILGVAGIALLWRRRRAPAIVLAVLLGLYSLFTASFIYEAWGWTVGPRHLAPLAAFLALPAGVAYARARGAGAAWEGLATGAALLSMLVTGLATATYPHYPEVFTNGFSQLTLPLLRGGYLPRTALGLFAGLSPWSWILYFAAFAAVLFRVLRASSGRGARLAAAGTAALGLVLLASLGPAAGPAQEQELAWVERTYRAP